MRSEMEKGSCFEFWIQAPAEELPAPAQVDHATLSAAERQLKILLVDDDALSQRVALAMLGRLGVRPDVARSGAEALHRLVEKPYDMVFMDLLMPEMDGIETTARIRAAYPGERGPRVVAMTASAFEEDRAACIAAGMADFVSKPVHMPELHAALRRAAATLPAARREEPASTLSMAALAQLRALETSDNPGFFVEICQMFASDAAEILARLAAAAQRGERAAVEREAHSLKSTSASLGAMRMVEQCVTIEAAARRGELAACVDAAEPLHHELARVETALAEVLS